MQATDYSVPYNKSLHLLKQTSMGFSHRSFFLLGYDYHCNNCVTSIINEI